MVPGLVLMLLTAFGAPAQPLPEELRPLLTLARDEQRLVDAVRSYHRMQDRLFEWDCELVRSLQDKGDAEAAEWQRQQAVRRLDLVEQAYRTAIRLYPNNARLQNYYGEFLYVVRRDNTKAVLSWKLATSLDPKLAAPHTNLGIYNCDHGQYDLGLAHFEKALELEPDNPSYLANMAQFYLHFCTQAQQRRGWDKARVYREALGLFRRAVRLDAGDYDLQRDYAAALSAAEDFGVRADWTQAAKAWRRARELAWNNRGRYAAWVNEGRAWMRAGKPEKAVVCLHEARRYEPDSAEVAELLQELETSETPRP